MKKVTIFSAIFALTLVLHGASSVLAGGLYPLPAENIYGATHEFVVDYSDFSETSTNTAETLTFTVATNDSVEFVTFILDTAFDTANTNYTGSLAVTVGDGTDADFFLTSTELASDGSEVYRKLPPLGTVTVGATGAVTTLTRLGVKVYTTEDTIDHAFTPNEEEATSANTSGRARFIYKIIPAALAP